MTNVLTRRDSTTIAQISVIILFDVDGAKPWAFFHPYNVLLQISPWFGGNLNKMLMNWCTRKVWCTMKKLIFPNFSLVSLQFTWISLLFDGLFHFATYNSLMSIFHWTILRKNSLNTWLNNFLPVRAWSYCNDWWTGSCSKAPKESVESVSSNFEVVSPRFDYI